MLLDEFYTIQPHEEIAVLLEALAIRHVMLSEGRLDEAGIWDTIKSTGSTAMKGITSANDAVNRLGKLAQDSKPVQNFDDKADELIAKMQDTLGQKNPKMLALAKQYAEWAKKNPVKQSLIIGALTAAAALVLTPAGASAVGFVLRAANELMKGEKLTTAVGKGVKGAVIGGIAGLGAKEILSPLADALSDMVIKTIPDVVPDVVRIDLGKGFTHFNGATQTTISGSFAVPKEDGPLVQGWLERMKNGDVNAFRQLERYQEGWLSKGQSGWEKVQAAYRAAGKQYIDNINNNPLIKLIGAVEKNLPAMIQGAATATAGNSSAVDIESLKSTVSKLNPQDRAKLIAALEKEVGGAAPAAPVSEEDHHPEEGYHIKHNSVYGKVLALHGTAVLTNYEEARQLARKYNGTLLNPARDRYMIKMGSPARVNESSGHIPQNDQEAKDPRWSNALTVDIKPGEDARQAAKMGWNVKNGRPPKLDPSGKVYD